MYFIWSRGQRPPAPSQGGRAAEPVRGVASPLLPRGVEEEEAEAAAAEQADSVVLPSPRANPARAGREAARRGSADVPGGMRA